MEFERSKRTHLMIMNDGNVDDGGNVDADDEVYLEAACLRCLLRQDSY